MRTIKPCEVSKRIQAATMNRNTAVTRTVSAGSCGVSRVSRTFSIPGEPQLQSARRHSSAGVRALKWATANARSLGSTAGLENQASRDNLFNNVVTPDSIPQFTIPSLAVQDGLTAFGKDGGKQSAGGGSKRAEGRSGSIEDQTVSLTHWFASASLSSSSSSSFGSSPPPERRAHRSISDPTNSRLIRQHQDENSTLLEGQDFPDPVTRAAFSLPHLAKVTTPYGFLTLSHSPQVANDEALFFQTGQRRNPKGKESAPYRHTPDTGKNLTSQADQTLMTSSKSCPAQLAGLKSSTANRISDTKGRKRSIQVPARLPKSRFWRVLQKHFTHLREK